MRFPIRSAGLLLAVSLLLSLVACGGQDSLGNEEANATTVNVSYGISNAWDSLMPYYSPSGNNYSRIIYDKIYDRLAYVQPDGTCLPRGAESWESAQEGCAILFHLNPNAQYHDGTPVTAQSWADSIALITDPACGALGRGMFACLTGTDDTGAAIPGEPLGAQAVEDYTLKLTFDAPVIPEDFLVEWNRDLYVLPVHLLKDVPVEEVLENQLWAAPIGSGPCRFLSELAGSSLVLEANPDYPLGKPGFGTMTITVMDKANLLTSLISGDLDYYAFGNSVGDDERDILTAAGFSIIEGSIPSVFYELMLNSTTIDKPIRQAIALGLDKELLGQQSSGTLSQATNTSILPGTPYAPQQQTGSYDPQRGADLAASYDGRTYTLAATAARADLAALIQQELGDIGISVQIETVDSAAMFAGMSDGIYDMGLASHTPTSLPLWFVGNRFSPENNIFHVPDLTPYTSRIRAISAETDPEVRGELIAQWEDFLQEEVPFVPLWFTTPLYAQSLTVSGIDYPSSSFSNENVWEWEKK